MATSHATARSENRVDALAADVQSVARMDLTPTRPENTPGHNSRGTVSADRWKFLRDVVVFQLKMLVDNVRDFALIPVSLGAAVIDLLVKGEREGALFYRILRWGAHSEKMIDVYSAIAEHEAPTVNPDYTIDAVVARLERVVVREVEKGGTAASIKGAMDRVMDQVHNETRPAREKATGLVVRAVEKAREKLDPPPI